eukprot:403361035
MLTHSPKKLNKNNKIVKKFSYNLNLASVDNEGYYTFNKQIGVSNKIEEGDVSYEFVEQFNQRQKKLLHMLQEVQESNTHNQDKNKKHPNKLNQGKKQSQDDYQNSTNNAQRVKKVKLQKIKSIPSSLHKEKQQSTKTKNNTIYNDKTKHKNDRTEINFNKGSDNKKKNVAASTFQAKSPAQPQRNNFLNEKQVKKKQELKVENIDKQIEELKSKRYQNIKKLIQQNYDDDIRSSLEVNVGRH